MWALRAAGEDGLAAVVYPAAVVAGAGTEVTLVGLNFMPGAPPDGGVVQVEHIRLTPRVESACVSTS